jgi:hypothetical protein
MQPKSSSVNRAAFGLTAGSACHRRLRLISGSLSDDQNRAAG